MSRTYAALLALVAAAGWTLAGPSAAQAQYPVGVQVGVGPVGFSYQQGYQTYSPGYAYGRPYHHHHYYPRPYVATYVAPTYVAPTVVVPAYSAPVYGPYLAPRPRYYSGYRY